MNSSNYQPIIAANLLVLRRDAGLTQEALAEKLGISFQAVSKWENGQSCPDITLLPAIADVFGLSIDAIFGRDADRRQEDKPEQIPEVFHVVENVPWDDDETLRGVVYIGKTLLKKTTDFKDFTFKFEGRALNVTAHCNLHCGNVEGNATAGTSISCGNVSRHVNSGTSTNCGNVTGNVSAGTSVKCGNVGGGASAGMNVNCGDIGGNASAGMSVKCSKVEGSIRDAFRR